MTGQARNFLRLGIMRFFGVPQDAEAVSRDREPRAQARRAQEALRGMRNRAASDLSPRETRGEGVLRGKLEKELPPLAGKDAPDIPPSAKPSTNAQRFRTTG